MGMQSLRFSKPSAPERDTDARPPAVLTFGICLLVGAAIVAIMLAAVDLGLVDTLSKLFE